MRSSDLMATETSDFGGRWQGLVLRRFPDLIHVCFVMAVFWVPVAIRYGAPDTFMLPKLTIIWLSTILAAGLSVMLVFEGGTHSFRSRITAVVMGFILALGVTTFLSDLRPISVIGLQKRYGGLIPQGSYAVTMILAFSFYRRRPQLLRQVAWACLAGASVMSAYLVVEAAGWDWIVWEVNGVAPEHPSSTMGNSNFAGGYLAVALPLSLYLAGTCRSRQARAAAGFACLLQLLALGCAFSRGALLALLLGGLVVVPFARSRLPSWVTRAAAGMAMVLAACMILLVWHPGTSRPPGPLARVRTSTVVNRMAYWRAGWEIFRSDPLVGTGPDTFYAFYGRHEGFEQAAKEQLTTVEAPHNIFVERAANSGLLGLGAYLAVLVILLRAGLQRARSAGSNEAWLLLALLWSSAAYLVQGFFSIDVPPLAYMGWMVLGAIASLANPPSEVPAAEGGGSRLHGGPRWLAHGLVVACTLVLLGLAIRPFGADLSVSRGKIADAIALQPFEARYPAYAGQQEVQRASMTNDPVERIEHFQKAESLFREALHRQPDEVNFLVSLAALNGDWGALDRSRLRDAELWWRQAVAVYPFDSALQQYHAQAAQAASS